VKITINFFLGFIFLINGILTLNSGFFSIGFFIPSRIDGAMKYILGSVEALYGIYIFYLLYKNKLS
jgi:hypothetical protein